MNARPNLARIDELGQRLADQAFRTLISLCPEIRSASPAAIRPAERGTL